ncbi:uncharacterized protein N7469_004905 [Penicillium citrinum]|uniref:Uncharacterized protein n=1 Tax=Penicillium citrinum TaxID=5077 RepID=A0A9W9P829_PENCI|nr:uncharacterized protein N7469_004905 [Penicillium citrinum]KAJ5235737.1 hypothetical protein N7469_004905 [Penicillium citrinum]
MFNLLNFISGLVDLSFWREKMVDSSTVQHCVHHGWGNHKTVDCEDLKSFREGVRCVGSPTFQNTLAGLAAYHRSIQNAQTQETHVSDSPAREILDLGVQLSPTSVAQDGMASETFEKMTRNFDVSFSQCTLLESHVNASEKASAIQQQDKKQQHQKQEHQQHLHQKHLHQQDHNQQEIKMEDNATTKLDAGQKEGIGMKSTLDSHMGQ